MPDARVFPQVSASRYPPCEHRPALAAFFSGTLSASFPERNIDPMPLYFSSAFAAAPSGPPPSPTVPPSGEKPSGTTSGTPAAGGVSGSTRVPNRQKLHELAYALR
jgi:hypothetical protein